MGEIFTDICTSLSNILLLNGNWEKAVTVQHWDMVTMTKTLLILVWQTMSKNAAL